MLIAEYADYSKLIRLSSQKKLQSFVIMSDGQTRHTKENIFGKNFTLIIDFCS